MENLSTEELKRYNRQIILSELGLQGQEKLKRSNILVVGAGGLGCPALQYVVSAGVGNISIIDHDRVEESNLQRQILYNHSDIGKFKAEVAKEKLSALNPYINLKAFNVRLTVENAGSFISGCDLVLDCSDNFETRYLVNNACVEFNKPFVSASIFKFEGQLSVFNYENGPTYRSVFPEAPLDSQNCSEIGVIGVLPGIMGSLQANEAIKIISGAGDVLSGKLLVFNSLTMDFNIISIKKSSSQKKEEPRFNQASENPGPVREITAFELKKKLESQNPPQLIDVRERYELEICKIPSDHIPLNEIPGNINIISKNRDVIILCHHGMRSYSAVKYLQDNFNLRNLFNLKGGINAWAEEVDKEMNRY